VCVEKGKADRPTPVPPELKDQDGASELTRQLLAEGVSPDDILNKGLIPGMKRIGDQYSAGTAFVPNLLLAARAMNAAIDLLKPYFADGKVSSKGTFIIGTVLGDLHDIGKNLVKSIVEGSGWTVIDLGTDVSSEAFISALEAHPGSVVGLSALLTTTMVNMGQTVKDIKERFPDARVLVGGAPLSKEFCEEIGADYYTWDPQDAADYLARLKN
jgi:methanogenic corrinoid protein MtbC1